MATLSVNSFSCIDTAKLELGAFTILIGPQATGKSLLSKLIYFCYDILRSQQFRYIEDEKPFSAFLEGVAYDFKQWFPPAGWGSKKFTISFVAGPYEVHFRRSTGRSARSAEQITVAFSDYLIDEYSALLDAWVGKRKTALSDTTSDIVPSREIEFFWRLQDAAQTKQRKMLREEFVGSQLFIPAGRSFFTSLGKAITAFEHGGVLEPITVQFGRLFASYLDRRRHRLPVYVEKSAEAAQGALAQRFFGGKIVFERDKEYVLSSDGRRLPFSLLSSGQQELLPLWITLPPRGLAPGRLVFIEEPEAHLFPSTQAQLTNHIASLVLGGSERGARLFITTHSPYVLASVNNLIKAYSLSKVKPRAMSAIAEIVPKASWLPSSSVKAYAIKGGITAPILAGELIDAEYLDEVSGDIAEAFSKLQAIEFSDEY